MAVFTALWFAYPHRFNASDPWEYSLRAYELMRHGHFGAPAGGDLQTFDFRFSVYAPMSLIYALFGVNLITTHLYSLLAALGIIGIVWAALPDTKSKLFGMGLCLISVPLHDASIDLYPDLIAATAMAASVLLLNFRWACVEHAVRGPIFAALAVFFVFFAFAAKATAYWVVPVWLVAFASDLRADDAKRVIARFYAPAMVAALVLAVAYLFFTYYVWGDPLARFRVIEAAIARQHASPDTWWTIYSGFGLLRRLTVDPAIMLYHGYGAVLFMSFLCLFVLPRVLVLWGCYVASCLILFWFGPTGLSHYDVLPLYPRYLLPALPGLIVLAAYFASRIRIGSGHRTVNRALAAALVLAVAMPPSIKYVRAWNWDQLAEAEAMQIVKQEVSRHPDTQYGLVSADARSAKSLAFYFGYELPKNLRLIAAADLGRAVLSADRFFLFAEDDRSRFLNEAYGDRVFNDEFRAAGLPQLYRRGAVTLYTAGHLDQLRELR